MEAIKNELMLLMKEKGYSVLNVNAESVDVLSVEIEINSEAKKIYAYVYDDRFALSEGFSCFDVLARSRVQAVSMDRMFESAKKNKKLDLTLCLLLKHYGNLEVELLKQIEVKRELISGEMVDFIVKEDVNYSMTIAEELENISEEKKLQEIIIVAEKIEKLFGFIQNFLVP